MNAGTTFNFRLFDHLAPGLGSGLDAYECAELVSSPAAAHVRFVRVA